MITVCNWCIQTWIYQFSVENHRHSPPIYIKWDRKIDTRSFFFLLTSGWISWIAINLQSVSLSSRKSYQLSFFSLLFLNVCKFYGHQALFLLAIFSFLFMSVLLFFFLLHNIIREKASLAILLLKSVWRLRRVFLAAIQTKNNHKKCYFR